MFIQSAFFSLFLDKKALDDVRVFIFNAYEISEKY